MVMHDLSLFAGRRQDRNIRRVSPKDSRRRKGVPSGSAYGEDVVISEHAAGGRLSLGLFIWHDVTQ